MTRKGKVVDIDPAKKAKNDEQNERINRRIEAQHRERDKYTLSATAFDTVLGELLEAIDRYFVEGAWNFKEPLGSGAGEWSGPLMDEFVEKLNPYAAYLKRKLGAGLLPDYPNPSTPGDPDGDLNHMVYAREEVAYAVGVFMGAKLAGASAETLDRLRKNLVL